MQEKQTIKQLYSKTAVQLAAENDVSVAKIYVLHKTNELAKAIKTGQFRGSFRYRSKYNVSLASLAIALCVQPSTVCAMERLGVLSQAIANAKKQGKKSKKFQE